MKRTVDFLKRGFPQKAEKLVTEFSLSSDTPIFTDYKEMLKAVKPDFVAIATDSGLHAEIAIHCAENKINFIDYFKLYSIKQIWCCKSILNKRSFFIIKTPITTH